MKLKESQVCFMESHGGSHGEHWNVSQGLKEFQESSRWSQVFQGVSGVSVYLRGISKNIQEISRTCEEVSEVFKKY